MNTREGVALATLAAVTNEHPDKIRNDRYHGLPIGRNRFFFADALSIEVAKQLRADGGVSPKSAAEILTNTGGVALYLRTGLDNRDKTKDFWLGALKSRNTYAGANRPHMIASEMNDAEISSAAHAAGPYAVVTAELHRQIVLDSELYPDADAARIVFVNVSAADRRLRTRAEALGVHIVDGEFADA